jgi:hypothetical protein
MDWMIAAACPGRKNRVENAYDAFGLVRSSRVAAKADSGALDPAIFLLRQRLGNGPQPGGTDPPPALFEGAPRRRLPWGRSHSRF